MSNISHQKSKSTSPHKSNVSTKKNLASRNKEIAETTNVNKRHKEDFERLLDDAVFRK